MIRGCLITFITAWLTACATSPLGHKQLQLFPDDQMSEMGASAFQQMKQETPSESDPQVNQYVECVADAITGALDSDQVWEVQVFEDKAVNAFALPGGKIGVYTGLLEVAESQDQLATVIGHEVAHVLAEHGNARMSAAVVTQAGLTAAQIYAASSGGEPAQLLGLLGLGAQVGILLPYGRSQESEADLLGLDLMASAGFDPRQSVPLWQNMAKAGGGEQPPEFMSTHPSHETRIENLTERMPDALKLYSQAQARGETPACG
ncbi:MAG: M48 family metallopeptidase [Gammaproteobacteria bacterium]|nr:M48 family metallopeptidase [Gammaproteobacteria bacterium]